MRLFMHSSWFMPTLQAIGETVTGERGQQTSYHVVMTERILNTRGTQMMAFKLWSVELKSGKSRRAY
jgi:hypothetical protein